VAEDEAEEGAEDAARGERIAKYLARAGVAYARLDGTLSQPQREAALASLRATGAGGVDVLLMSQGAGGFGLSLVEASVVFLLTPHWNPQVELQALARVHRLGQTKQVFVKRLIVTDSIEERIVALQARKLALAAAALAASPGAAHAAAERLSEDDLRALFAQSGIDAAVLRDAGWAAVDDDVVMFPNGTLADVTECCRVKPYDSTHLDAPFPGAELCFVPAQAHFSSARMGLQTFTMRQHGGGLPQCLRPGLGHFNQATALLKVVHTQWRGKTRGA
jgi:hypothetical protein